MLTKSKFVTALNCPSKLYFMANNLFSDTSTEDTFLEALAEGGFQVGELAKLNFHDGVIVDSLDVDVALEETISLLERDTVTIFEAAIRYENCFVRIDILEKIGDQINLYEVKAKSFNSTDEIRFQKQNGELSAEWRDYLYDAAFQKWVCLKAYENWKISAHLMLADKAQKTSAAGLNQAFKIRSNNGRTRVEVTKLPSSFTSFPRILTPVKVDNVCDYIYSSKNHGLGIEENFERMVYRFSNSLENIEFISSNIGTKCAKCEFTVSAEDRKSGKLDGRQYCFKNTLGVEENILSKPNIFDLWNFRGKDQLILDGKILLEDMDEDDLKVIPAVAGLSNSERQFLQIQRAKTGDNSVYFDKAGLLLEKEVWKYPLHFIDFETTMVALPFGAHQSPYEGIAFQFSHHTVESDGTVKHTGEFINAEPGVFPNFDFIRSLKAQLGSDNGTIFRYSHHENTFLNLILEQLQSGSAELSDKDELIEFIKSIAKPAAKSEEKWSPNREMVDLLELVKKYYFDPATKGSNSIKYVLPSVLRWSQFLQTKYAKPVYGSPNGIPSKNFKSWSWFQTTSEGLGRDPYDLLPKLFSAKKIGDNHLQNNARELNNGGAALTAYAKMQFEDMPNHEREEFKNALLRYCELDTLAMVMIYEAWVNHV
tara:strand:- start:223 stop:2178 length:1956 start_codon:yes stop_codon:yes gene_type:complete